MAELAGRCFRDRALLRDLDAAYVLLEGGGREAYGVYQVDGRVLEDESKRAIPVADFVALAGLSHAKRPLRSIFLSSSATSEDAGTSLEQLLQMHGSIDVAARAANAQADRTARCAAAASPTRATRSSCATVSTAWAATTRSAARRP